MARILVTDDSNFIRRRTCAILKAAGHDIVEANNGITCMEAVAEQVPDVLFLDLVMPEMDGFEVLQALQNAGCHVPVIVLTADIQDSVKTECMTLGAAGFLNKPPKADAVLAALAVALGQENVGCV